MKKQWNKHEYFTCTLCLVEQPIDELSEDGQSCQYCYDEDIEVIEEIQKEYKEYNQ